MIRKFLLLMFLAAAIVSSNMPSAVAEGKYQIKEMTLEVSGALENRKARFEQLRELKSKVAIGENNRGYIEALDQSDEIASLVSAENNDRKIIYQTIARQNGLEGALETIEKTFAQVQRDKAETGDKIQTQDGAWITK